MESVFGCLVEDGEHVGLCALRVVVPFRQRLAVNDGREQSAGSRECLDGGGLSGGADEALVARDESAALSGCATRQGVRA